MRTLSILLSILLVSPAAIAIADDDSDTHTNTTDSAGTTVTTDTSHKHSVGVREAKESTEDETTVIDPKGLMNKETTTKHFERKVKPNGDFSESTAIDHADGTKEVVKAETSTDSHWTNKGTTTTTTHSKSLDPAGLGNKKTEVVDEIVETNPGRPEKRTITKKIDGTIVSDEMTVR